MVPDGFKIPTNKQRIDGIVIAHLQIVNMRINGIEFAMAAPFDSNLITVKNKLKDRSILFIPSLRRTL